MKHNDKSPLAGEVVRIKKEVIHPQFDRFGGEEFTVEDWLDRIGNGGSWMDATGNPACLVYAMRSGFAGLPTDDEVLCGKVGRFGHLVHISEVEAINKKEEK